MLEDSTFWADEAHSQFVSRIFEDFPETRIADVGKRLQSWLNLLPGVRGIDVDLNIASACKDSVILEVFEMDAERNFTSKDNPEAHARSRKRRQQQVENMKLVHAVVGGYHHELAFIVAFLQLFLPTKDIARIMAALHRSPRHLAGYFTAEPHASMADARLLGKFLAERQPAVVAHLSRLGALPEVYAERWFVGLAVRELPLLDLLDFWEAYFQYGYEFVLCFGLEYINEFSTELLAESTTAGVMAILTMEDPQADSTHPSRHFKQGLIDRFAPLFARALDMIGDGALGGPERLDVLRQTEAADVAARAAEAQKRLKELEEDDDGIAFSDEED